MRCAATDDRWHAESGVGRSNLPDLQDRQRLGPPRSPGWQILQVPAEHVHPETDWSALRRGPRPHRRHAGSAYFSSPVHTGSLCEAYVGLMGTVGPHSRAGERGPSATLGMAQPDAAAASLWQHLVEDERTSVTLCEKDAAIMPIAPLPAVQNGVLSVDRGSLPCLTKCGMYAFDVGGEWRRPRDLAFPVSKGHVWATDGGRTGSPVPPAAGGGRRWGSR